MADGIVDLPFRVEYAVSGRAACKGCKEKIEKTELRVAVMVQSHHFDGKVPNWFHEKCFFQKQRPATEGDIEGFENLRAKDQESLRKNIADGQSGAIVAPGKKGTKRGKSEGNGALKDFGIEYAKSGRAKCCGCELKIAKNEIRIKKVVYDTEIGIKFGGQPLWHHSECFAQVRNDLGWFEVGDQLPGFKSLKIDDQKKVKDLIPAIKMEDIPEAKKFKEEVKDEVDSAEDKKLMEKIQTQNKKLFKNRDWIEKNLKNDQIIQILEENDQTAFHGETKKLQDQLADILTFGAFKPCTICESCKFIFSKSGYICTGNLTEWTICNNLVKEPARVKCIIPEDMKDFPFLSKYKCTVAARAIKYVPPSVQTLQKAAVVKKEDELDGPRVKREKPALYDLEFVILGMAASKYDTIRKKIIKLGGKVGTKIHEKLAAIISTRDEVTKMGSRMQRAKECGIQVVPVDYLDAATDGGAMSYITSKSICDWGTDPHTRVPQEDNKSKSKSKSIYTKSVPKSQKLKLKNGTAVDPDSGLEDVAHVYTSGTNKYGVVLGLTDIQLKKNSYYKLQLLESDSRNRHWVFRSWGRIGTTIGNTKLEDFHTLDEARRNFETVYYEKTGNLWNERNNFKKIPGRMYPIDIDYGEDEEVKKLTDNHKIESKLPESVQKLIQLIFDVETMKKVMLEFDLDMEKMPLGKLSKTQIQSAYEVLTEISELIKNGGSNSKFIDCTNRFYTLIPHSFGIDNPPILNTDEQIKNLSDMLDSLIEIECAYGLLKSEKSDSEEEMNPIDKHYAQISTDLEPLVRDTEEFKILEKYVQNTHAETHAHYTLEIVDIFKVKRQGELRRYKPFKKMHNRKLLWHGSRLTNFAGILSHGLKIAPPEAPATGYMFGKGIYFADMVSKSANYCCTSKYNNTGILLLSEVALGNMHELKNADYITMLPKGKNSTKGIGRTQPDPKESYIRPDGVEIPLGKGITDNKTKTSLLYNEYIVYDIAQVNIQYLFRMNFDYKY